MYIHKHRHTPIHTHTQLQEGDDALCADLSSICIGENSSSSRQSGASTSAAAQQKGKQRQNSSALVAQLAAWQSALGDMFIHVCIPAERTR
jgi:hypothetical protein